MAAEARGPQGRTPEPRVSRAHPASTAPDPAPLTRTLQVVASLHDWSLPGSGLLSAARPPGPGAGSDSADTAQRHRAAGGVRVRAGRRGCGERRLRSGTAFPAVPASLWAGQAPAGRPCSGAGAGGQRPGLAAGPPRRAAPASPPAAFVKLP